MNSCYYVLDTAPDFSLSKYASLSETGPGGVLAQQRSFWRQINQWGKLFGGSIHFVYQFDREKAAGQRMQLVLRFDAQEDAAIESIRQIMQASILAPYYEQLQPSDAQVLTAYCYPVQVNLLKRERFITSSTDEREVFYTTSDWEMNQEARLYSMLRIMEAAGRNCAYCVDIYPVDYCEQLEKSLTHVLPHLRSLSSFKVKTGGGSVSSGGKDENASRALDYYEDLQEEIAASPHYLVNVQVLGETDAQAREILDAAASEALSGGTHTLYGERFGETVQEAISSGFTCWSDPESPEALLYLPHLMTLEELASFAVFPVLYPGEAIEMPKETVPAAQTGMKIGTDTLDHEIYYPWKQLSKHVFLAGMPGSGKTNTMMYLISEMHKAGIPVLVLEPAKKEYRSLTAVPGMEDISLFSPCANSMFPIHINPFEFPRGMKLADHINRLFDIFNGTFQLDPPFPMLLTEGIQNCYEKLLWLPGMVNRGELEYPTMRMLYSEIEKLFDKYQYEDEVRKNLQSVLQVRIGSLMAREMGDIFDVEKSTFAPEMWMEQSAVIEMSSLGTAPSNFMILTLMTLIRETLDIQAYDPQQYGNKPRHMIFLEEAHNLIANTSVQAPGGLDPKVAATAYITRMLAEVRALGEGIVIADQLPTAMAPEVVKNTSLKFGLRLTSQDERELLGQTMSADAVQMERMGILTPGQCLVSYEGLQKPFELQIPEFKGDSAIDDPHILLTALCNPVYHRNMLASARIMRDKFDRIRENLIDESTAWIREKRQLVTEGADDSQILAIWRDLEVRAHDLLARWYRLDLDAQMYLGVTMIRKERLAQITPDRDEEIRQTGQAHDEWLDVFVPLIRAIRDNRKQFTESAADMKKLPLEEMKQRYLRQQDLIMDSWK